MLQVEWPRAEEFISMQNKPRTCWNVFEKYKYALIWKNPQNDLTKHRFLNGHATAELNECLKSSADGRCRCRRRTNLTHLKPLSLFLFCKFWKPHK